MFSSAVLAARILGKDGFGRFSFVQSSAIALTNVASLGLGLAATKYTSHFGVSDPQRAGRILGLCGLIALAISSSLGMALLVLAEPIAAALPNRAVDARHVQYGAVFVFFVLLNSYQQGAIVGFEEFRRLAVASLCSAAVLLSAVPIMSLALGVEGAVAGLAASAGASWLLHHRLLRTLTREHGCRTSYRGLRPELGKLMGFALPAAASGFVPPLAMWWGNLHLVALPTGAMEMAAFSAANTLRIAVLFLPGVITRVASPWLNRLHGTQGRRAFRGAFQANLAVTVSSALAPAVALGVLAGAILELFGEDFGDSAAVARILLIAAVVEVAAVGLFQILFVRGNLWWQFLTTVLWAGTLVGTVTWSFGQEGARGLAKGYVAAWCVSLLLYAGAAVFLHRRDRAMAGTGSS
jgi:O-antigen/teichoic acid export membrane protein